jgi:hypothetical protein
MNNPLPYPKTKKVVTLYSGGKGSCLAHYLLWKNGYNPLAYFNDTFYESPDLYKFLASTLGFFEDVVTNDLYKNIPDIDQMEERKEYLYNQGKELEARLTNFVYDVDSKHRSILDVFDDKAYLGNSRVDICSEILKRNKSSTFIKNNYDPEEVIIAIGIGIYEAHRLIGSKHKKGARSHWKPYKLVSLLINAWAFESELWQAFENESWVKNPQAYKTGFGHNNCYQGCVKAGLAHWRLLLESNKELFLKHEANYKMLMDNNPRMKPFLKKRIKGQDVYLTLTQFREMIESGKLPDQSDEFMGSCVCAI